jgi:hypothetical protein
MMADGHDAGLTSMRLISNHQPGCPPDAPSGDDEEGLRATWSADEAAHYIAELAGELAGIARGTKLDLVAYLLDIVRLEAARTARRINPNDN